MNPSHAASVVLSVELGPVETGLWCSQCYLPSGWRAPLLSLSPSGVAVIGTMAWCRDGDHPLPGDLA